MPTARDVYDHPENHWSFLTAPQDTDFEGQHFDRKEAGRPDASGRLSSSAFCGVLANIAECVSAFANSNHEGSLLVIGISKEGNIKGINHLSDTQRTTLTRVNNLLINQTATAKFVERHDDTGSLNIICFFFMFHIRQMQSAKLLVTHRKHGNGEAHKMRL